MLLNNCFDNICNSKKPQQKTEMQGVFKVTVVAFEDRCNVNCGKHFADLLGHNSLFEVNFCNEVFPKGFLNLQGRNFFDFIDQGKRILADNKSDVVIWGYEENGKIRLNFQTMNQYTIPNELSFSLLDGLFVPLNYFTDKNNFSASLLLLIYGIIVAIIEPVTNEQRQHKSDILKDIIERLSKDTSPKDISREFMPFIMNMLGKVYLSHAYENFQPEDIEIIEKLLSSAIKNKQYLRLPLHYGCIYNNLGQLYETAFRNLNNDNSEYLKTAIRYYREAQKYMTHSYPFDYGIIAYHLSLLHFEFWKKTDDLQALRDAVAQLREAEKVYTLQQFPQSWSHIEGFLGYYLCCLGSNTKSNEIMQLAICSYQNQQKIYNQIDYPKDWAKVQEDIGNIYYLLGKYNDDDNFMYEARNYFNSALEVYNQLKDKNAVESTKQRLLKLKNYIN